MPSSLQKTPLLKQGNAQYNALLGDDERLRLLLEAWAELPESVKAAALEMVRGYERMPLTTEPSTSVSR